MGIVSQHEGNIWAENIVGGGAAFNVELPSNTGAGVPVVERGLDSATLEIAGNSASHILVVDDEPDSRTILAKQFELRRHDVDQAGDGEEAWRKLQRLDYDCILLDLRMPGMGGQELYERIKVSIPDLVDRIVFITGDTVNPATRSFLTGIGNAVLSKPFDFRELEQLVLTITNRPNRVAGSLVEHLDSDVPSVG